MDYLYTYTVFTPTFNRANTLHRVYESLKAQTFKDFEWIIVDDGSKDDTETVVKNFIENSNFPITYTYQENQGKHIAWNKGVSLAKGKFFVCADSDDSFLPNSLEFMLKVWNEIPAEKQELYKGVSCRCFGEDGLPEKGQVLPCEEDGNLTPYLDISSLDLTYKVKFNAELWGMNKTSVLKEYPFPEEKGLRYYPENYIWDEIAKKYICRFVNTPLRLYYHDQINATTYSRKNTRFNENYFAWLHILNDLIDYRKYDKKTYLKALIGITRDAILSKRKLGKTLGKINRKRDRVLAVLLLPFALILAMVK